MSISTSRDQLPVIYQYLRALSPKRAPLCSATSRLLQVTIRTTSVNATSPVPTATLFQRLAALRGELDRIVHELNALCAGNPMEADRQLRDLREQFKGAVYHLELTLDYLTPLGDQRDRPLPLPKRGTPT